MYKNCVRVNNKMHEYIYIYNVSNDRFNRTYIYIIACVREYASCTHSYKSIKNDKTRIIILHIRIRMNDIIYIKELKRILRVHIYIYINNTK